MTALLAATLAVLIDLICRFRDYRALLHLAFGRRHHEFLGLYTLVSLQMVALFYPSPSSPAFCAWPSSSFPLSS